MTAPLQDAITRGQEASLRLDLIRADQAAPANMALSLWKGQIRTPGPRPSMRAIACRVACEHGLTMGDLVAHSRRPRIDAVRREAMRAIYATRQFSMTQIAGLFGRDPSTVHTAIKGKRRRRAA